jgi:hypothetical protein
MTEKRPRGRPRLDRTDCSVQVCVTLPARRYDVLSRTAQREQISLPALIRRELFPAARDFPSKK